MTDVNLKANVMGKKKFVWAGRAPCGLAQTENVCARIIAGVSRYHDSRFRWARENCLVLFLITPPCKKLPIKKYYQKVLSPEISTSRSLDMIGKISLVMWLHLNQSYSKNLSMWDINIYISTLLPPFLTLRSTGVGAHGPLCPLGYTSDSGIAWICQRGVCVVAFTNPLPPYKNIYFYLRGFSKQV